jgi:hypothetical protein
MRAAMRPNAITQSDTRPIRDQRTTASLPFAGPGESSGRPGPHRPPGDA